MLKKSHLWPAYRAYLKRSTKPILCGPFRGEVGFEALYWVPFLKALDLPKERLIPITRGSAYLWYPADRHVELYSLRDPREVRVENTFHVKQTGIMKQTRVSAFDRAVVKDAAKLLGLTSYDVLHPSWMYQTLEPFWQAEKGLAWLMAQLKVEPFTPVEANGLTLPEEYVAVRFYYRHTFPMTDAARTTAIETVKHLAKSHTVVVLNADVHADEHVDVPLPDLPNVIQLKGQTFVTPQNNLAIQSAVISKAIGFVGTYGGLAQLAMLYKKPTVSFYTEWGGTAIAHKHLADAIALQFHVACHVIRLHEISVLREVLPAITLQMSTASTGQTDPIFGTSDVAQSATPVLASA